MTTSHKLRPDLPPMPASIAALPVGPNGYPTPWFVPWVDGPDGKVPEFRAADPKKLSVAIRSRCCWVCGEPLGEVGGRVAFVIGPMCSINRVSAEPPCHEECAVFSAKACPFLSKPHMKRRENDLPAQGPETGVMIRRNPGVCAVWITRVYQAFRAPKTDGSIGVLFDICSHPDQVLWFAEGRTATRAEVEASIDSGLPLLRETCGDDGRALAELHDRTEAARIHLPAA